MSKNLLIGRLANVKNVVYVILEDLGDGIIRETFDKLIGGDSIKEICTELIEFLKIESFSNNKTSTTAFIVKNLSSEIMIVETNSRLTFLKPLRPEEMKFFYDTYFTEGKYV